MMVNSQTSGYVVGRDVKKPVLNVTQLTELWCPFNICMTFPAVTSQIFMPRSSEVDANIHPLRDNMTDLIGLP